MKRKMREEIEKAERAKKELIKEQMLEAEKQKEIMRIREEVCIFFCIIFCFFFMLPSLKRYVLKCRIIFGVLRF